MKIRIPSFRLRLNLTERQIYEKFRKNRSPLFIMGIFMSFVLVLLRFSSVYLIGMILTAVAVCGHFFTSRYKLFNRVQMIWISFGLTALFSSALGICTYSDIFRYSRSTFLMIVFFVYLVSFLTANCFSGDSVGRVFFSLYRDFMLLCSAFGLVEYVLKIQPYKRFITSASWRNNFENYGDISLNTYRMMLIFNHPIHYGVLLMCGIIALYYIPYKNKYINYIAYALMLFNVILTQARTSWILLVLFFILVYTKKTVKNRNFRPIPLKKLGYLILIITALLFVIYLIAVLPIFEGIRDIINKRLVENDSKNPLGARITNFSIVGQIKDRYGILFFLFGGGNGFAISYLHDHPTLNGWISAIDNQFLTVFIDFGIVGLTLFLSLLFVSVYKFYKNAASIQDINYVIIILLILSGISYEFMGINTVLILFVITLSQLNKNENMIYAQRELSLIRQI